MNDNPQNQSSTRYEDRRQRREARRAARGGNAWIGGAILILLGLLILGQNMKIMVFENWWALFILLPAVGSFSAAWRMYQQAGGTLTMRARSAVILGLVLTAIAAMFLFNLNWTLLGPGLLILAGLGILVNTMIPGSEG